MSPTVRQAWPVEQGQVERAAPDQVGRGADFLQLDPASAPPGGIWPAGSPTRRPRRDHRRPPARRRPAARHAPAGRPARRVARGRRRGLPAADRRGPAQRAARRRDDRARRGAAPGSRPGPRRRRPRVPDRPAPRACPTCPRSRAQAWLRAERAALARTPDADARLRRPARHPRAAHRARDVAARGPAGCAPTPSDDRRRERGRPGPGAARAGARAAAASRPSAYEDPGSRGTRDQLERWGLALAPGPGGRPRAATSTRSPATGSAPCSLTPAHQYPTGVVLAPPRRRALLDWAGGRRLVIEDDYDAEHRYDRAPVAALAALAPEHVVYLGSVSKTLAPALRLGWVVAPPDVREELVGAQAVVGHHATPRSASSPSPSSSPPASFERHLRKVRARQRTRRDALLDALREHLPGAPRPRRRRGPAPARRLPGRRRRRRRRRARPGGRRRGAAAVVPPPAPGPPGPRARLRRDDPGPPPGGDRPARCGVPLCRTPASARVTARA